MLNKTLKLTKIAAATAILASSITTFAGPAPTGAGGSAEVVEAVHANTTTLSKKLDNLTGGANMTSTGINQSMALAIQLGAASQQANQTSTIQNFMLPAITAAKKPVSAKPAGSGDPSVDLDLNLKIAMLQSSGASLVKSKDTSNKNNLDGVLPNLDTMGFAAIAAQESLGAATLLNYGSHFSSSAAPQGGSDSDAAKAAATNNALFIYFLASGYDTKSAGMNLSDLNKADQAIVRSSANYTKLTAGAYTVAAQKSVGISSIKYALSSNVKDTFVNHAIQQAMTAPSPTAPPITLMDQQKSILSTLGVIAYELHELHQDNKYLIASAALSNIQQTAMTQVSSSQSKAQVGQLINSLKQKEKKKKNK